MIETASTSRFSISAGATCANALQAMRAAFEAAGNREAAREARLLLLHVLQITPVALATEPSRTLAAAEAENLADLVRRRLTGEPVARLLGAWEFWGLPFELSPATLVPRPDTETLVEQALRRLPEAPGRILDLGAGTGCILLAILSERPSCHGVGIDLSFEAAATARRNADRLGLASRAAFFVGDWGGALASPSLAAPFTMIVSNPPYIESAAIGALDREVRAHDPALALDGGTDGLDAYRRLTSDAPRLLRPGGCLLFEIGQGQGHALADLGRAAGLELADVVKDLRGIERVVVFHRP